MAVTATAEYNSSFDRYYYETQKGLALAPAIGAVALSQENLQGVELRRRHEVIDGIAEAIPGVVKNTRYYKLENNELVAEDGQAIEELLHNGLREAVAKASNDTFYAPFGPQRARHELDEFRQWQEMANDQAKFNTLITVSPYSQEYAGPDSNKKLERAGQAPEIKRSMLRLAHWDGQMLSVTTRSIDNSSLDLLKNSAATALGYSYHAQNTTQMLGERIQATLSINEARDAVERFVSNVDQRIGQTLGEECLQGRPLREAHDTQKHVESEVQIIDNLMSRSRELASRHLTYEQYETAWHKELYRHTSLIKMRIQRNDTRQIVDVSGAASAYGAVAAAKGESYNMCGLVISVDGKNQNAAALGFESVKGLVGKKITCPQCREKVVVPKAKLREGKLCCSECRYEIDACTGKVYSKSQKPFITSNKRRLGVYEAMTASVASEMAQIDYSIELRRQAKKDRLKKAD